MSAPLKLLVVDDDDSFRLAIKAALAGAHYIVETCDSGEAAINLLQTSAFDVMILDYRMPGISGLNVLQWMHEQKMDVPVIMLTAMGSENVAVEAMKLGAYDYFAKDTIDIIHLPIAVNSAHERFLFKKEKAIREAGELDHAKRIKAVQIFSTTLSSLAHVVNNSLALLQLDIQEDKQALVPLVRAEHRSQVSKSFTDMAQELNVISISVRTMLNLSDAMCKQMGTGEDGLVSEFQLKEHRFADSGFLPAGAADNGDGANHGAIKPKQNEATALSGNRNDGSHEAAR